MSQIADYSSQERKIVQDTVDERYGEPTEVHLADAELMLSPEDKALTTCPTLFWYARKASFAIIKTGKERYRCQFFYEPNEPYGTGVDEYDDLPTCVAAVLQVQADDERTKNMKK